MPVATILLHTHIMDIYPVVFSVPVDDFDRCRHGFWIGFIHKTGYGFSHHGVSIKNYIKGKKYRKDTIQKIIAAKVDSGYAQQENHTALRIRKDMFSICFQCKAVVYFAFLAEHITQPAIDNSRKAY